jgi:predicted nucleotidyltransferase
MTAATPLHPDPILAALCEDLVARHGCHTAILYGSHARGDARDDSDYDIAGFGPGASAIRDARTLQGRYVDVFVYPEAMLAQPDSAMLKLREGVILFQREDAGTTLLRELDRVFKAGPPPLPPDEAQARRVWAWKMLDRAGRGEEGDVEGDYRRVWLLTALLEDYFTLRDRWFLGPKEAMRWLDREDRQSAAAFRAALRPQGTIGEIEALVERVVGPRQ